MVLRYRVKAFANRLAQVAAIVIGVGVLSTHAAFATGCTSPNGAAGDIIYSSTQNQMAYCNGSSWISMGTTSSASFGSLTLGDFCFATSGSQISCTTATVNLSSQASGSLQAAQFPALTGDVTTTAGSLVTAIGANTVTAADLAQIAGLSVLGNGASSTGNIGAITGTANQFLGVNGAETALAFGPINFATGSFAGALPVIYGGTGDSTLTANGVLVGNGTGTVTSTPAGVTGTVLIGRRDQTRSSAPRRA
jgi:hypothetical protein